MINLSRYWQSVNYLFKTGLFLSLLAGLSACNLSSSNPGNSGNQITVVLHDSPGPYSSVVFNVQEVDVRSSADNSGSWIPLNNQAFSVDLLSLINKQAVAIGGASGLNSGTYDQLRLKLGTGDQVWVNSKKYPLAIDSTINSEIDVPINSQIDATHNSVVMLDFDVARSISVSKDSTFTLKPVIRADERLNTGDIQGSINQSAAQPVVYAINIGDTLTSTYADGLGGYYFLAIKPGTYAIAIHPLAGNYKDTTLTNVQVSAGQVTQLGLISLKTK